MKLNAKPNLNGNTEEDFNNVYVLLNLALDAINKAHSALRTDILNSRNYQHTDESVMVDDRNKTYKLFHQMHDNIGIIKSAIVDTLLEEELNND